MKTFSTLMIALFLSLFVFAQSGIKSDIPMDPTIRTGKLENGLTYYIKQNKTPEKRAEFYLVVNAGAIQETPGQNGLAHFTEHMCFNGTKNFPGNRVVKYMESIGNKFGNDVNAYTSTDRTVYTLTKVPVDKAGAIDTTLMVLYDKGCNVTEDAKEIDAERGVIREEFRTRMSGMARASMEVEKALYIGSKYEIHNVIGDTDVINYAPYDTLRAFYRDWYRPDLEAIIIVGDIDVDKMEAKVKEMFSKMPAKKNPKKRNYYKVPGHKEPRVAIAKDKEAPYNILQIFYTHQADLDRSEKYYRGQYIEALYSITINARLNEIKQKPDNPFTGYVFAGHTSLNPMLETYITGAMAPNDKISDALKVLITESERVKRYGFTETELERAKKDMLSNIEKSYKERNKQKSSRLANVLIENFLTSEPVPSDDWEYDFGKKVTGNASLDEVNALAKKWITDENVVVGIMGLDSSIVKYPTEQEVKQMLKDIKTAKIEPYVDKFANRPLVAVEPAAGTIIKDTKKDHGIVEWELSNGVKVVFKPTDFKDDEILMGAQSYGGWSVYKEKDDVSARIAAAVARKSGVGDFDKTELEKQLAGKSVYVSPYISGLEEGFNGRSTVDDFPTMLQLTYLYFTKPRFDKDAFNNYVKEQKDFLVNKAANPDAVFSDTIRAVLSNYHKRYMPLNASRYDEAKLSRVKYIFSDRFGDPSGFTFYFVGNVNPDSVKAEVLKYLGGLPTVKREETFKDLGMRYPESVLKVAYQRELKTPKATVFIAFTGVDKYDIKNRLMLEAIKEYLNMKMIETLREDQGGTYGASVFFQNRHYPASEYFLGIYFDCNPAKLDTMVKIVYDEVDKLIADGPEQKKIDNIVKNKLKDYSEDIKENRYWLRKMMSDDFDNEDFLDFDYVKFWEKLTPKQVQKAAKKFLSDKRVIQVVASTTGVGKFR